MHTYRSILLLIVISLLFNTFPFSKDKYNSQLLYLSPVPGSKYITKETNIIIRYKDNLNFGTVSKQNFLITGSKSGNNSFHVIRSDEKNTIILKPDIPFKAGEEVKVNILSGFKMINSKSALPYKFKFTISDYEVKNNRTNLIPYERELRGNSNNLQHNTSNISPVFRSDSLPPDFPDLTVITNNSNSPGNIFISNIIFGPVLNNSYLMVLNNNGYPIKYTKANGWCLDFKVQMDNTFTYYTSRYNDFYAANSSFNVLESFHSGNGYVTDGHDFILMPDYHAYLMAYDTQMVDMSKIVPGGDPSAAVIGLVIQELDEYKTVIFQWRSWDHFKITDATHENLQDSVIDYVHGNSMDIDYDGNLLISSRHLDEITKINRQTGDIIWRLGGKNNQFTFTNDTLRFSHQHAFRRISNGHYTVFDNGNFHTPPFSRAIEYNIDQENKTCTLVWQYRHNPSIFSFAMGYAQRLANGNTVIGWGSSNPTVTEVDPAGNIVYELSYPMGVYSYRAYRQTWTEGAHKPYPAAFRLYQNFPNPFNPLTTIRYDVSEDGFVSLKIYDMLGREVKDLVHIDQGKGKYAVTFNAGGLASGVYFYKLTINDYTESRKMMLVK
jgi:hypothetical protein